MNPVFVGLGANSGNPTETLHAAINVMRGLDTMRNIRCSTFRTTKPVGGVAQPDYVNAVLVGDSEWHPECLLSLLHCIELSLGRNRGSEVRWGPRPIDLDLLMVGNMVLDSASITLPHPEMTKRRFVLEPLAELAPSAIHPVTGQTMSLLLENVQ